LQFQKQSASFVYGNRKHFGSENNRLPVATVVSNCKRSQSVRTTTTVLSTVATISAFLTVPNIRWWEGLFYANREPFGFFPTQTQGIVSGAKAARKPGLNCCSDLRFAFFEYRWPFSHFQKPPTHTPATPSHVTR
jgi:hypothetical protein